MRRDKVEIEIGSTTRASGKVVRKSMGGNRVEEEVRDSNMTSFGKRLSKRFTKNELRKGKVMQLKTDVLHLIQRKPVYLPKRHNRIARAASLAGVTGVSALGRLCNVSPMTAARWLRRYAAFRKAFEEGINTKVIEIEAALAKRAIGYEHKQKTTRMEIDSFGAKRRVVEKRVVHIPGDVSAAKFFLENRSTKRWTKSKGVPTKSMSFNISVDASDSNI